MKTRAETYTGLQLLLNKYWTLFSDETPKGFGKFFGKRDSKPAQQKPETDNTSSKGDSSQPPREPPRKPNFEFKMSVGKDGSDGKKGGGKDNSEREKWFTFGMIGSAIAIAALSYYGYSYQEISWKDLTK